MPVNCFHILPSTTGRSLCPQSERYAAYARQSYAEQSARATETITPKVVAPAGSPRGLLPRNRKNINQINRTTRLKAERDVASSRLVTATAGQARMPGGEWPSRRTRRQCRERKG